MKYQKARLAIYTMAGVYLLFLAYNMFSNLSESTGAEYYIVIAACIAFLILGISAIVVCMYKLFKVQDKEYKESKKNEIEDKVEGKK